MRRNLLGRGTAVMGGRVGPADRRHAVGLGNRLCAEVGPGEGAKERDRRFLIGRYTEYEVGPVPARGE